MAECFNCKKDSLEIDACCEDCNLVLNEADLKERGYLNGAVSSGAAVVRQGQDGERGEVFWRKISDETPDDGPYLCFHPHWPIEVCYAWQGKFGNIGAGEDKPTHFMELPFEPKEA